jgi:hypothetical protein
VVLYLAICACLLLWFPQPKRIAREEKIAHLIPSASTTSVRRWLTRCPSFHRATRGLSPPLMWRIWRPLLPMVCSVLSPAGRSQSGWPPGARPTRLRRRGMWSVSSPSMSGGLECQRAASCGHSCTTTGWSCITSTQLHCARDHLRSGLRGFFWGLTLTGTCGPISSPRSSSSHRRMRRRSVWRCGPVAAPSS